MTSRAAPDATISPNPAIAAATGAQVGGCRRRFHSIEGIWAAPATTRDQRHQGNHHDFRSIAGRTSNDQARPPAHRRWCSAAGTGTHRRERVATPCELLALLGLFGVAVCLVLRGAAAVAHNAEFCATGTTFTKRAPY